MRWERNLSGKEVIRNTHKMFVGKLARKRQSGISGTLQSLSFPETAVK
jgi:hypothetical protein